jgi:hypothetical protein
MFSRYFRVISGVIWVLLAATVSIVGGQGDAPDCDDEEYELLAEVLAVYTNMLADNKDPGEAFVLIEDAVAGFREDCSVPEVEVRTETWYVTSLQRANVRSCPATNCEVAATVGYGDEIEVISTEGDWHEILLAGGAIGYIATFLTSEDEPTVSQPQPTQSSGQQTSPSAQPTQATQPTQVVQPTQPPPPTQPPAAPYVCDCNKTCGAMASCEEAYYQLNQCGCSQRDSDGDGVPCESLCPGG